MDGDQRTFTELTPGQERYAQWLATPQHERKPSSVEKLAVELGVHHTTVYRWKKLTAVLDRVHEIVEDAVGGMDRVRQVVDRIFTQAMEGNAKQQELFLKYAGVMTDRRVVEKVHTDYEEMSDEELEAEIQDGWDDEYDEIVTQLEDIELEED